MHSLVQRLKSVPKKPGIYWFKNKAGKVIYIGKALSLQHRLKSYFQKNITDPKTRLLVSRIASFSYQLVPSEFDALLLEAKLIKNHRPKYNIQLKDGKSYLYIAVTRAPYRIFPVRQSELTDHFVVKQILRPKAVSCQQKAGFLDWFGPFPSGSDVRQVLRTIRRVLPFCTDKKIPKRQCLYFHLGLCPGYQNLDSDLYRQQIRQIRQILSGHSQALIKSYKQKMQSASRALRFEEAQQYKERLLSLQYLSSGWKNVPKESLYLSKALLKLRQLLVKHQGIDPTTIQKIEGYDISNLSHEIIVGAMVAFTNGQPDKSLYRKFKISFAGNQRRVSFLPRKTPGVETSLTPGVGELAGKTSSVLLHRDGTTQNPSQNDPEGIFQILSRRLNHPEWLYPQLILVDGGQTQVSAVVRALREKGLIGQICLIGLTKGKEEIVVPRLRQGIILGWKKVRLSRRSPVLQLLQYVRDESHRFAQAYYKKLHRRKTLT